MSETKNHEHRTVSVYVYELPVRLWHWVTAASVITLAVTGFLIATPPPTIAGDAADYFMMGYTRLIHFVAGYIFGIALLYRMYWALVGNKYARELFYIRIWSRTWTTWLWHQIRWILFLEKRPLKYEGHNPMAHVAMFFLFVLPTFWQILTGFAMHAEAGDKDALMYLLFGWVIALFPNTQDLHTWHHAGMWVLVCFALIHVYITVREDIMSRQSMISTMISGERMFKDDLP